MGVAPVPTSSTPPGGWTDQGQPSRSGVRVDDRTVNSGFGPRMLELVRRRAPFFMGATGVVWPGQGRMVRGRLLPNEPRNSQGCR